MTSSNAIIEIDGRSWRVETAWSAGRTPRVVGIMITSLPGQDGDLREIDARTWHAVPIGRLIAAHRPQPEGSADVEVSGVGRPRAHGIEHYRRVVEVYRSAIAAARSPVEAVAGHFDVNHTTARRWVHVARTRHGLLPAVRRGQAG